MLQVLVTESLWVLDRTQHTTRMEDIGKVDFTAEFGRPM